MPHNNSINLTKNIFGCLRVYSSDHRIRFRESTWPFSFLQVIANVETVEKGRVFT